MRLRELIKRTEPFINILLSNYRPIYTFNWPVECDFCGKGPCKIRDERDRGICGLEPEAVLARYSLSQVVIGMNTHVSSLQRMVEFSKGRDFKAREQGIATPIIRSLFGYSPTDIEEIQEIHRMLVETANQISSVLHMGQESKPLEYERWSLLAGLVDLLSLELAEFIYNSIQPELNQVKWISYGPQTVEEKKPTVLIIGHLPPILEEVIREAKKTEEIELLGLCCMGHEASRAHPEVKFVGALNQQVKVVSSGIADVVVVDEQCVMPNLFEAAIQSDTKVICVSPKIRYELENFTGEDVEETIERIVNDALAGGVILEEEKAAKAAVKLAKKVHGKRNLDLKRSLMKCTLCEACEQICPRGINLTNILSQVKESKEDVKFGEELKGFWDKCIECKRCELVCPEKAPILGGFTEIWCETQIGQRIKSGRGSILDDEIRVQAPSLVLGSIPGVITLTGCPEYPGGTQEIGKLAHEFISNKYIVLSAGCSAAMLAETGTYTKSHHFEPSSLINLGSCFANSHVIGTLIKTAHYQALLEVDNNYSQLADFIYNKISSCCVLWGIIAQKTFAIAHGAMAFGVPVIIPSKPVYRKTISRKNRKIELLDVKWDKRVEVEHVPDHMLYVATDLDDCLCSTVRLCMRHSDTASARRRKLQHYLDLGYKRLNKVPENVASFIRTPDDIPKKYRDKIDIESDSYIPDTTSYLY